MHAPHDDEDDVELDECNGHYSDEYGYHYHANPLEENATLTCLTGLIVEGQDGGGGPPGGGGGPGGGGPPGGGPGGGGPPAAAEPDDGGGLVVAAADEGDHSPDNTVILDVGSYELNEVRVDLGSGNNAFLFVSGEVEAGLYYLGLESSDSDSCLLYTSPSPRDKRQSRMPSSA